MLVVSAAKFNDNSTIAFQAIEQRSVILPPNPGVLLLLSMTSRSNYAQSITRDLVGWALSGNKLAGKFEIPTKQKDAYFLGTKEVSELNIGWNRAN